MAEPGTAQPLAPEGLEALRAAALALIREARREAALVLLVPLDLLIYGEPAFAEAVRELVRARNPLELRALVAPGLTRLREGQALWRLAQDLPSYVQVRRLGEEQLERAGPWLTVGRRAYLERTRPDLPRGAGSSDDPRHVRELRTRFDELWTHAEPDPECRRLGI